MDNYPKEKYSKVKIMKDIKRILNRIFMKKSFQSCKNHSLLIYSKFESKKIAQVFYFKNTKDIFLCHRNKIYDNIFLKVKIKERSNIGVGVVDKGLIKMMLKMTPEERLDYNVKTAKTVLELRNAVRKTKTIRVRKVNRKTE